MRILDKYIARTVLSSIGLVTLVLIGLQMFILFVAELDNIGQGDYTLGSAFVYILLQMPYQVYLFFPIASLLGSLIGLGLLAGSSELIAMRSAGTTVFQIILAVLKASLIVILLMSLFGETIMPRLVHFSQSRKAIQTSGGQALQTAYGVWLRSNDNFIHVGAILPNHHLKDVTQYQFNEKHELVLARFIKEAVFHHGRWMIHNVSESRLQAKRVERGSVKEAVWNDVQLSPGLLSLANVEPDEMTIRDLWRYIQAQRSAEQHVGQYELAYWQRWFQPLASCAMMFLAIPFIFGPLRQSTMGTRIVLGAAAGFGFHMLNKFFGSMSLVYQFSPVIGAAGPAAVCALLAAMMMRRVR